MDSAKNQLIDALKKANNILITVSRDPSVDQLAACIGLTLLLNKMDKHATAVFSGRVPSTIEFLQPEETLEKNTDSLRDFIIALDKSKADKLRYKVENDVVRIFITPYRTSISQDDLEFSQGDFNVDVVVALGVQRQEDFDEAITSHGRILHDATLASINTESSSGELGTINWNDASASSLSELVADLALDLDAKLLDKQMATALLTGIVAETERFSNSKTSSETMRASAALMAAGADQQLVASELEAKPADDSQEIVEDLADPAEESASPEQEAEPEDSAGTLRVEHEEAPDLELPAPQPEEPPRTEQPAAEDSEEHPEPQADVELSNGAKLVTEPPTLGGQLTANTHTEQLDPVTDPMSMLATPPLLDHLEPAPAEQKADPVEPAPAAPAEPQVSTDEPILPQKPEAEPAPEVAASDSTLADLEASVREHAEQPAPDLEAQEASARNKLDEVLSSIPQVPEKPEAFNAQMLGDNLNATEPAPSVSLPPMEQPPIDADPTAVPGDAVTAQPTEPSAESPSTDLQLNTEPTLPSAAPAQTDVKDPNAPPPVPPPFVPQNQLPAFDPTKFSSPTPPPNSQS